ncbi:MAG: polysaccharide deacetylase family protein [Planctomycetota bacterium]|jgi:peptidoglycan/xylan/chitin deacetylase (PgdA/CDA1 family)|nr:polysaccharide deacetylase family protein [Planctomycetota bacterium]
MSLKVCPWKHGKRWVYSITYDEALADLHRFAIPIHEEFGFPGHVEAVVGQLGEVRQIGNSSYNGFRHMNGGELQDLLARGWGVGNHSWSHELISPEMVDRELLQAKEVLEEAIDSPVDLYCAPGNNSNMADHVLEACREYGYLGAMSLTDALNRPGDELFWLNRTALHDQYYGPFFSEFDPYRNIRHAREDQGWIIDYCHCPLEEPVHRNKDCTQEQLRRRFETVASEGGDEVWCALPEEVVFYHLCRRHVRIEEAGGSGEVLSYRLRFEDLNERVTQRELTFDAEVPAPWCQSPKVWIDGSAQSATLIRPRLLRFTVEIEDGMQVEFRPS